MATWPSGLGKGLQSPVPGFDSQRRLSLGFSAVEGFEIDRDGEVPAALSRGACLGHVWPMIDSRIVGDCGSAFHPRYPGERTSVHQSPVPDQNVATTRQVSDDVVTVLRDFSFEERGQDPLGVFGPDVVSLVWLESRENLVSRDLRPSV